MLSYINKYTLGIYFFKTMIFMFELPVRYDTLIHTKNCNLRFGSDTKNNCTLRTLSIITHIIQNKIHYYDLFSEFLFLLFLDFLFVEILWFTSFLEAKISTISRQQIY